MKTKGIGGISEVHWADHENFKHLHTVTQKLFEDMRKTKNDVLVNIAKQILKREPLHEDTGKFQLVSREGLDYEVVCYENVRLGIIKQTYNGSYPYNSYPTGFEFIPDKEFKAP